jgi:MoxR-like ATPase
MDYSYTGEKLKEAWPNKEAPVLHPYIPEQGLIQAVNLALLLRRPLLLMGEPGCGKTILAKSLAFELHGADFKAFYREWNVKSTSKATQGLYEIDHIARLRKTAQKPELIAEEEKHAKDGEKLFSFYKKQGYLKEGPLSEAIRISNEHTEVPPAVILIDEIDKADIDFPNDLLFELERGSFKVPELGYEAPFSEDRRPIVIITSNNEKPLPAAFLRRCVFHYINFPKSDTLSLILRARFGIGEEEQYPAEVSEAFMEIRNALRKASLAGKNISTSELIDWYQVLDQSTRDRPDMLALKKSINESQKVDIPFHQVLLKNWDAIINLLPVKK